MKSKYKKLLSAMLVVAAAKVAANPTTDNSQITKLNSVDNDGESALIKEKQKQLQKYIIKFSSDNSYLIAGHRSHSSHRSHRSHSSHRSSSGNYSSPSYSSPSKNSTRTYTYPSNTTVQPTEKKQNTAISSPKICNLGDRAISFSLCGTDIKELAALLVKHGYLAETDIVTDPQGYVICNEVMVAAIKKFQKDAGLKVDGLAGMGTINALKNWKKD